MRQTLIDLVNINYGLTEKVKLMNTNKNSMKIAYNKLTTKY